MVRMIAAACRPCTESQGAHQREHFRELDPGLDDHHAVLRAGAAPSCERWD
jgi:hypothetical protein